VIDVFNESWSKVMQDKMYVWGKSVPSSRLLYYTHSGYKTSIVLNWWTLPNNWY